MKNEIFQQKYGPWALVAGAAAGIGAAYCEELAAKGLNIFLIDKDEKALNNFSTKLSTQYNVEVDALLLDLANPELLNELEPYLNKYTFGLMIYNAAYGPVRRFHLNTIDQLIQHVDVNCRGPILMAHIFREHFVQKESGGGMIFMTSMAGYQGAVLVAPYAATKAFDLVLGESLYHELAHDNIDVLVCTAGATLTQQYLEAEPDYGSYKPTEHEPVQVAREALSALGRKSVHVVGSSNRLSVFMLQRILGRKRASRIISGRMMQYFKHKWNE